MTTQIHLMTIDQLTRVTGRAYRTIRDRLADLQPAVPKTRGALYDTRHALPLIYSDGGSPDNLDLAQERAGLARMQRTKIELEVGKLRGELVLRSMLSKALEFLAVTFRSRLMSLPRKLALQISPENPRAIEAKIEAEVHAILHELEEDDSLPDWIHDGADVVDRGGDSRGAEGAAAAAEADRLPVGRPEPTPARRIRGGAR